jgi:hypothetical protein
MSINNLLANYPGLQAMLMRKLDQRKGGGWEPQTMGFIKKEYAKKRKSPHKCGLFV